jgi:hypothetical protein
MQNVSVYLSTQVFYMETFCLVHSYPEPICPLRLAVSSQDWASENDQPYCLVRRSY